MVIRTCKSTLHHKADYESAWKAFLQVVVVPSSSGAIPEGIEARDGVTPPMKDARKRRFRKSRDVNTAFMRQVEDVVLMIASVSSFPALTQSCQGNCLMACA